jgi:hypothetical protein
MKTIEAISQLQGRLVFTQKLNAYIVFHLCQTFRLAFGISGVIGKKNKMKAIEAISQLLADWYTRKVHGDRIVPLLQKS